MAKYLPQPTQHRGKTMMTTVKSEHTMDDPMGMEQEMEDMIVSSQLNDMEDAMANPPKKLFTWRNLRLQTAISGQKAFLGRSESPRRWRCWRYF